MQLLTLRAQAWMYSGDWVADCPGGCGNVEHLFDQANPADPRSPRTIRKTSFWCSYCHHVAEVEWAANEDAITAVLSQRPIPHTRNWFPSNHDVAVRANLPHGQSVQDLIDESEKHGVS